MERPRHTLPRQQRLKSRTAINRLFSEGKRGFVFPIRFLYRIERLDETAILDSTKTAGSTPALTADTLTKAAVPAQQGAMGNDATCCCHANGQYLHAETADSFSASEATSGPIAANDKHNQPTTFTEASLVDRADQQSDGPETPHKEINIVTEGSPIPAALHPSLTPTAAILVSVPKRLHKRANVRNLLKRRMREAYRLNQEPLRELCAQHHIRLSIGLLYSSGEVADYTTIENAVRKIIHTIQESC